jgi:MerR family mercuric resistance operon transcriptional regulator
MRFITRGRELGFSLVEIRSLLALADDESLSCSDVDRLARQHLAEIRARVRELNRMAQELGRTIDECKGLKRTHCTILDSLRVPKAPKHG